MNAQELKEFLDNLRNTDIEELRLQSGDRKIYFKRSEVVTKESPRPAPSAHKTEPESTIKPIKAPMVGTFYHSTSQDHPPFVVDGENIVPGQKVGIIETMKIIKDVTSSLKGKIVKVSVKNGQSVEYGQELFLVDTGPEKKSAHESER